MKPCWRYKKSVALLAASVLTDAEAAQVKSHLCHCVGCREYFTEIALVCEERRAAERELPSAQPSFGLTPRLLRKREPIRFSSPAWFGRPIPKWLLGAAWAAGLALLAWVLVGPRPLDNSGPTTAVNRAFLPSNAGNASPGSKLIHYRLAVNRSVDDLNRLLDREASTNMRDRADSQSSLISFYRPAGRGSLDWED